MELVEPKRSKPPIHVLWIILSCIPFLNWIGFLLIGISTDQKKWKILGYVHFVLSLVSAGLLVCYVVNYDYLVNPYNESDVLFPYFMFMSWLVGVIQVWWISGEARKRLHWQVTAQEGAPATESISMTKKERIQSNLVYLLFALVPISGLSLVHVGKTIQQRKYQLLGWISFGLSALFEIAYIVLVGGGFSIYHKFDLLYPFYIVITQMPVLFLWVFALLHVVHVQSAYTVAYVKSLREYEQLKLLYPCLNSTTWKIKQSIHFLWCLYLFAAPITLIHAGISDRKWKRLVCGIGSLAFNAMFITIFANESLSEQIKSLFDPLFITLIALWIAIVWFSIATLREHFVYAAEKCDGFVDSFDAAQAKIKQVLLDSAQESQKEEV